MATVIWSEKSVSDLEEIFDYIAIDSPFYAQHQVEKIIASVDRLHAFPTSGRPLPEFPASHLREVIVDPYRVVYRTAESGIFIIAVIHGKRLLREEILA
ncbi:type II toxin-antitoxin system RelE/ParE family toxin [Geotalea toluenoxydans]|uniref:type II toxin-antitoxin system RelE/ParE family toxin n=1 Tax=Geotalea toluenoxydans TaxID=421624 RepID=UPI0006D18102|nr:type II toxin-antitoxin system RelE/ParE family toxin [Geotalea toluenoxydans]